MSVRMHEKPGDEGDARRWRSRTVPAFVSLGVLVGLAWGLTTALPTDETLLALGQGRLDAGGVTAVALFVASGTLLCAVGLPRQSVALLGGYLFGAVAGVVLTVLAVTLGCALTVETARALGRAPFERRSPTLLAMLDGWGRERVFARTLAVRLFPVGSNLALNLAAGVTRVDRRAFLSASAIGFVPQTLVFGIAGEGVGASSPLSIALAMVLLAASIAIGLRFGRARGIDDGG